MPKGRLWLFSRFMALHGLLVGAVTAAGVRGLLEPLHADGGDKVLHPQHVVGELLVDEGAVGEAR